MSAITQKLDVKLRNEFTIELSANRTTGHGWEADYDKSLLQLSTIGYKRLSEKPGGGWNRVLHFQTP